MEIIKRKIKLNNLKNDFYLKIPLTQNIDDMGLISDLPYEGNKISKTVNEYFKEGGIVISATDSKLKQLKTYDADNEYKVGFDIDKAVYNNYKNDKINGVSRVTKINGDNITYVFNGENNNKLGTSGQTTGILYEDNPIDGLPINGDLDSEITISKVQYKSEGWNNTNTSLDPQIREGYLLGIINEPEVDNDVFINRGGVSVLDKHLRLSEIESLDHLIRYGNGFYNINRD